MKPIYEPKGRAKEYGDYALNIYTGCPHRCYYCFAPGVLRREFGLLAARLPLSETKSRMEKEIP